MKRLPQNVVLLHGAARCFVFALLALGRFEITAQTPPSVDRTWELKLSGQPSGSFTGSTVTGADGKVTTREKMAMEINRLGSKVSITNETETVEDRDGEMQSLLATTSSSQAATRIRVTRIDHALQVETKAGDKSYQKTIIVGCAADARIVVLTTYAGDDRIHRALEAGASAYLLKDAVTDVLLETIRKVHAGGTFVDPAVAAELAQRSRSGPSLSDREIEVLRMISSGKSNKEIAAALFVAESTVKTHVASIYEKLRVTDRTEAVVRAIQRGIIRV